MSLEQAEREYFKYLQKKVRESKQAAIAAEVAAATVATAAAAPAATPVAEEVAASKKRGRKPKLSVSTDFEAARHIVEGMRP